MILYLPYIKPSQNGVGIQPKRESDNVQDLKGTLYIWNCIVNLEIGGLVCHCQKVVFQRKLYRLAC